MKYLNLSIIALCIILFSTCTKDDNSRAVQPNDFPQVKSISVSGAIVANFSYNTKGQLSEITYKSSTNLHGTNEKFTYDAAGKLMKAVNSVDSIVYSYNSSGMLLKIDSYRDWKTNTDPTDTKMIYSYDTSGKISSISFTTGTKAGGETMPYVATYNYNSEGLFSGYNYSLYSPYRKFIVNGYNDEVLINPIIFERFSIIKDILNLNGIARLKKIPRTIYDYEDGELLEGYTFNLVVSGKQVNKIESTFTLKGNLYIGSSYTLQY